MNSFDPEDAEHLYKEQNLTKIVLREAHMVKVGDIPDPNDLELHTFDENEENHQFTISGYPKEHFADKMQNGQVEHNVRQPCTN